MKPPSNPPLPIGTHIEPYGTINAVAWLGERYYFMVGQGGVAMMPASIVERNAADLSFPPQKG